MRRTPSRILGALFAASSALLLSACATSQTSAPPRSSEQATQTVTGAVELEWQAPRDRLNGTPLQPSDIAGYRIYIGDAPGHYTRTVDIDNPQTTRYLLQNLQAGKEYYFAITTVDKQGQESPKSGEAHIAAAPLNEIQMAESAQ